MNKSLLFKMHLLLSLFFTYTNVNAIELNGFELEDSIIPQQEILRGGPPRDGIPALTHPKIVNANKVTNLQNNDIVMGIEINGIARAYPIRIMNWHEIVNDSISGKQITVSYCPLCGSGVIFDANVNGKVLTFGVSGLLYNSDVLLYDKKTSSLWSQLESKAVTGQYKNTVLKSLPFQQTTWANWLAQYPDTEVLSFDTGYSRNYQRNPYAGYGKTERLFFPVQFRAKGFHPKEKVIAIVISGVAKAWPFLELRRGKAIINDVVGGEKLTVEYNKQHDSAVIRDHKNQLMPTTTLFWFAWSAFHPETEIYNEE